MHNKQSLIDTRRFEIDMFEMMQILEIIRESRLAKEINEKSYQHSCSS